jgi:putative adenylate-forming enzyme
MKSRMLYSYLQGRRLKATMTHLSTHSPFYSQISKSSRSRLKLSSFPVLEKKEWIGHFDEINTVNGKWDEAIEIAKKNELLTEKQLTYKNQVVGLSSGTTHFRGLFLVSPIESLQWAGTVLAKLVPDLLFTRHRIALFLRSTSQLYETMGSRRLKFRYFNLVTDLNLQIEELIEYDPSILVAQPSYLSELIKTLSQRSDFKGFKNLRKVVSVAEVLEDQEKLRFETFFKVPVFQIYQATEGFFGVSCRFGSIHLNEDLVHFEWESLGEGRFVPIVNDLSRRALPIVRFRMNDVLKFKDGPCPCKSPLKAIEKIEGRKDDVLYFRKSSSPSELKAIFPDDIRNAVLLSGISNLESYQIVQSAGDQLTVSAKAVTADVNPERVRRELILALSGLFEKLGLVQPQIVFAEMKVLKKNQKFRRVIREFEIG